MRALARVSGMKLSAPRLVQFFREFWALMQMLGHSFIGHRKFQHFLIGSHGPHELYAHRTPVSIKSCRQADDWEPGQCAANRDFHPPVIGVHRFAINRLGPMDI